MKLKTLFEDDGAVSPVIGVILMVAITVILAAVIGTFVLGLGDQVSETGPTAQLSVEAANSGDSIKVIHDGGDSIEGSEVTILVNGDDSVVNQNDWSDELAPGESRTVAHSGSGWSDGEEIEVRIRHDESGQLIANTEVRF